MKRKTYASILVLAGVLCACGAQPVQQTEAEPTAAVRPTAPADNMLPEAEGVTAQDEEVPVIPGEEQWPVVGMVISRSGIDDGSFNQSAWEGLQEICDIAGHFAPEYDAQKVFEAVTEDTMATV